MLGEVVELERAVDGVPDDWRQIAVAEVVAMLPGFAFKSENFVTDTDEGLPLIRIRDLGQTATVTRYVGGYDEAFAVQDGDILVGMDGTFEAVRWQGGKALLNQRVLKLSTARPDAMDEGYLFYRVQPALLELEQTISGTTVKHLSTKDLKRLTWQLPPLDEQRRIAEVLRSVDEAIAAKRTVVEQTKHVLSSVRETLLQPRRNGIKTLPESWSTRQLGQVAKIATGKTPSTKDDSLWNGDVAFVTPSDMRDRPWCDAVERYLSPLGASTVTIAPAGAILFTCIASIGKSCILSAASAFNQQINACIPGPQINGFFLYSQLQVMADEIRQLAGTTAVAIINKSTFSAILIHLPPLDEQQRIAEVLMALQESADAAAGDLDKLIALKGSISADLLSGRVRVPA